MFSSARFLKISLCVLTVGVSSVLLRSLSNNSKASSDEDYWAQTGLMPESLEDMLFSSYCSSGERYFLACVGSLVTAGEHKNLQLNQDGTWSLLAVERPQREALLPWADYFKNQPYRAAKFPFTQSWRDLLEQTRAEERAHLTGVALNGFISILRDPHTYLMPLRQFSQVNRETESHQNILGLTFARTKKRGVIVTRSIFGTPAYKAGVRVGDQIVAVNALQVKGLLRRQINELLKGEVGEITELQVLRGKQSISMAITREEFDLPSVSLRVIEKTQMAVLSLNKFARGTCDRVETLLKTLNRSAVRGVLLDVRGNPGGSMTEANCIAGLFLGPDKKIFEIRYLDPSVEAESYFSEKTQQWAGALAVLIDGGSASSAEILAGALRDHQRALLVGDRTYGKGSFQEGSVWDHNDEIAIFETKGFFYLPSGETPQLSGLQPDIQVLGADYEVLREENQFLFPLMVMSNPKVSMKSGIKKNSCEEVRTTEDKVVDKAASFLFCTDKIARVE